MNILRQNCLLTLSRSTRLVMLWVVVGLLTISSDLGNSGTAQAEDFGRLLKGSADKLREQILQAAQLPGGESLVAAADQPIVLWVDRCFLGSNDVYSGEGFRYLVVRLAVGNRTDAALELRSNKISLKAGTKSYSVGPGETHTFRNTPLEIDWTENHNPLSQSQLETPQKISIAAGRSATFWCVFFGLDAVPVVPAMELQLPFEGSQTATLDFNAQQNARLGLTMQMIGPADSLAALTIHGHLNRVNSALLAERMTAARAKGCQRFLIEWVPGAHPSNDVLFSWLSTTGSGSADENPQFGQLPLLPSIRKVALCRLPKGNEDVLEWEEGEKNVFDSPELGAVAVLQEIYERLSPPMVLAEIRHGHPWSRLAALQVAGSRLGSDAYPTLVEMIRGTDSELRKRAILQLGWQSQGQELLQTLLHGQDVEDAATALSALVVSASEERQQSVITILKDPAFVVPRERAIRILAGAYHPAWDSFLVDCVSDPQPAVRQAALKVLQQIGHPQLRDFCVAALKDSEKPVREIAFQVLVESGNPVFQREALGYAEEELKKQEVTETILRLVEELRETRVAPLLIKHLKERNVLRFRLIQVIGQIGTDQHCQQVIDLMDRFDPSEQFAAIELARDLSLETQLKLAGDALRSSDQTVRRAGVEILKRIRTDESAVIIGTLLKGDDEDEISEACFTLGSIGTAAAVQELRRFRAHSVETKRPWGIQQADAGLREWRNRQPGRSFIENGEMHMVSDRLDEALKSYNMALLINPDLSEAYSMRGNVSMRREKFAEAGKDFAKALELDPNDSQAVTGVAIVQAIEGKYEDAVKFVNERSNLFPKDPYFPYNTACVYSRAIEAIQKTMPGIPEQQRILELQKAAIEQLQVSIDNGFNKFNWMGQDPDLVAIRELPEFKKLLKPEEE